MPRSLSATARRFLSEDVDSVLQLELMLLLARDPDRPWTAETIARELRAPDVWAAAQLAALGGGGLGLARAGDDGHRFDAAAPLAPVVAEVAAEYPRRRTTIIELIFSRAADPSSG